VAKDARATLDAAKHNTQYRTECPSVEAPGVASRRLPLMRFRDALLDSKAAIVNSSTRDARFPPRYSLISGPFAHFSW
jgi:hypothetical protein